MRMRIPAPFQSRIYHCENHGRCATGTDEGGRPYTSKLFPLRESSLKKIRRITELLSRRCYTGLGFFVFAEELPGRAFARMRLPVLLRKLSGARPVNELLDHPSEHISHSGAISCSQSAPLLVLLAFSALVIVLCIPAQLAGQDSATGSIRGTVVDPTGARVTTRFYRCREHRDWHALHRNQRCRRPLRPGVTAAGRLFGSCGSARHVAPGHTPIAR